MKRKQKTLGEILLVDDNQNDLQLLSQLFEGSAYRLRMACNGQQALWAAVSHQPDLILLDVHMPGMSGLDVCRCLKHYPATASIPVVILSAADDAEDRVAGFEAGAADFIGKPFVDVDVLARVRTHVDMSLIRKDILRRRNRERSERSDSGEQGSTLQPCRKEILVVEDTPESLQLLAEILKNEGFVVREAPNGELALWSATRHHPDLVLLDIRMPGMNGIDVCRCLKTDPDTRHIPVIFISALSDTETMEEGFAAGAIDYIAKPFVQGEVLARVNAHLRLVDEMAHPDADTEDFLPETSVVTRQDIEEAFSYSACAIMFLDAQGQLTYVNPSFVRLTGYACDDLEQMDLRRIFGLDLLSAAYSPAACSGHGGECALKAKDGRVLDCRIFHSAVFDDKGRAVHLVALEDLDSSPQQQAIIDSPALNEFATFSVSHSGYVGLEEALYGAVARDEMTLLYQPILDVATRRVVGAEALLRWNHPGLGMLAPAQFLLAAEETGEILAIGAWVIDSACAQLKAWCGAPLPDDFRLAVNVGILQFWQDGLIGNIESALSRHGLMAASLELDITVETLREDMTQGIAILHRLKDLGVMLALDRYGHGSLPAEALARLPLDTLKIDPMPILSMNGDPASQAVVRSIIELAHSLRLRVVANGIEQKWHLTLVQSSHCDLAQGYLLGAPLPASRFLTEHLHVRP